MTIETVATLLERERELKELGNALTEAQQARGQFVLVEAPAGLGFERAQELQKRVVFSGYPESSSID